MLDTITPEEILSEGHQKELTTYKGVMVSKTHADKDIFKINLLNMIDRALNDYQNKEEWNKKVKATMNADFGWSASAKKYIAMYANILNNR